MAGFRFQEPGLLEVVRRNVEAGRLHFTTSTAESYVVEAVQPIIDRALKHLAPMMPKIDQTDGISLEFPDFRFNLRASNTEPLLRLNVESRQDIELVQQRVKEIETLFSR